LIAREGLDSGIYSSVDDNCGSEKWTSSTGGRSNFLEEEASVESTGIT